MPVANLLDDVILNHHKKDFMDQPRSNSSMYTVLSVVRGSNEGLPLTLPNKNGSDYVLTTGQPILSGVTNAWHPGSGIVTIGPKLTSTAQLSLTCVYVSMFGLIFFLVYIQLWMIWFYRHRRLSHQTLFLYLCLIWSGLRTSLFSFSFKNCDLASNLDVPLYWVLYSLPVCLQFSMLCLLLHYFAQVVFKATGKYTPSQYKIPLRLFLSASVIAFMAMNLACAIVTKEYEYTYHSVPYFVLYIRVSLTEGSFLIYGILLSTCIFKMSRMSASKRVLEAKGTSVRKAMCVTSLINLLFLSRAVYNIIAVCDSMRRIPDFGYDWINVNDQADVVPNLSESMAYVSFGLVLIVWEVLPTVIVVIFFRVKRLHVGLVLTDFSTQSSGSRVFFFDNPRRYDSDDDLFSHSSINAASVDGNSYRSSSHDIGHPRVSRNGLVNNGLSRSTPSPSVLSRYPSFNQIVDSHRREGYGSLSRASLIQASNHGYLNDDKQCT